MHGLVDGSDLTQVKQRIQMSGLHVAPCPLPTSSEQLSGRKRGVGPDQRVPLERYYHT